MQINLNKEIVQQLPHLPVQICNIL